MKDPTDTFVESHPDGATCEEVAAALGVSKQRAHALEVHALAKLSQVPWLAALARENGHELLAGRGMAAIARRTAWANERVMRALDDGCDDTESIGDAMNLDETERLALGKRIARLLASGDVVASSGHPRTYRRAGR